MKLAEFAALVKASKQAVSKAAAPGGRLRRSITRDERGRVVDIDRDLGLKEWRNAEMPRHPAALEARLDLEKAPRSAPVVEAAPELLLGGLDALQQAGRPFVGIRISLAPFLRGAAAALREAGREATPEALRAVVEGMGEEAWWTAAVAAVLAALDEEIPAEDLAGMWEREGRAAVLGPRAREGGTVA